MFYDDLIRSQRWGLFQNTYVDAKLADADLLSLGEFERFEEVDECDATLVISSPFAVPGWLLCWLELGVVGRVELVVEKVTDDSGGDPEGL
jgi:hypothetical protein